MRQGREKRCGYIKSSTWAGRHRFCPRERTCITTFLPYLCASKSFKEACTSPRMYIDKLAVYPSGLSFAQKNETGRLQHFDSVFRRNFKGFLQGFLWVGSFRPF